MLAGSALWLLLGSAGCGSANYRDLFENGPGKAGSGSASGSLQSSAGSSGMAVSGGSGGGSLAEVAGSLGNAGSGGSGAGCAFSCGDAGRSAGGRSGLGNEAGSVSAQAGSDSELVDCSAFAADAVYLPATQHCYLVDKETRTFAAAQAHCTELKAHLITLGSDAEDAFAWSIHSEEHWIGAKDGKAPKQSGVGTYTWTDDEPFDYTNWSAEQPNASKTECTDGGACYEHCAFQWTGGEHDGQWNDRYCMHTIAAICEWDKTP